MKLISILKDCYLAILATLRKRDEPIDPDTYLKVLLALTIWREARRERLEGMRAVGHVIRNRTLAWKQDWDQVISQKNQFSSMTHTGDAQLAWWPDDDSELFRTILNMAARIFNNQDSDPTHGALYYWNPRTATSRWFRDHIAGKMQKVAVIGNHEFFSPRGK